jgi:TPR repeat protein
MAPGRLLILFLVILLSSSACEDRRADKAYVRGDYGKALTDLEFLANGGEPRAQYDLGVMYDRGDGVQQSDAKAMYWYERAAAQGEPRAQYNLGLMYLNGQGVSQDPVKAYYWISLSANRGNVRARDARDYVADKLSREQITAANTLIKEYEEQAARIKACVFCNPENRSY